MITGIIGPDGSGKTTMCRRLAGMLPAKDGIGRSADRIGYVAQKFGLYPNLTVMENLRLYARINKVPKDEFAERSKLLLDVTTLSRFTDRFAGKLSGGMKQKLAITCALIHRPEALILDEPTVGVDKFARRDIWGLIRRFSDEFGMDAYVSTTYTEEKEYCDKVIDLGEKEEFADPVRANPPPADAPVVVKVEKLVKRFGSFTAVDHVSFEVRKGEIFGMLGANGAGKTTTFRMICGLDPATEGRVTVSGIDLRKSSSDARARIGFVAQKFSLYGDLTLRENLRFFGSAYGLAGARLRERMDWAREEFALDEYLDRTANEVPAGIRQRLAMAAALLHEPDVLFLDEATSGADVRTRHGFWKRIMALADKGVAIVITTHYDDEVRFCDRSIWMKDGKIT